MENELSRAYGAYWEVQRVFWSENLWERAHVAGAGVDGRIDLIFKWMLEDNGGKL
jgi:hypothetical protein